MMSMMTGEGITINVYCDDFDTLQKSANTIADTLGKTVELNVGDTTTKGIVEGATRGENPQILVKGMYYSMDKIRAIYAD